MRDDEDGARLGSIDGLLPALSVLALVCPAIWTTLPRAAKPTRPVDQAAGEVGVRPLRENKEPGPVPQILPVTGRVVNSKSQPIDWARLRVGTDQT